MAEVVRTLKKLGAKNREINASIREVMEMIKQNRAKKKAEEIEARKKKNTQKDEAVVEKGCQDDHNQTATQESTT